MKTNKYIVIIAIALLAYWGNQFFNLSLLTPSNGAKLARLDLRGFDFKPYQRQNLSEDKDAQDFALKAKGYKLALAQAADGKEVSAQALVATGTSKTTSKVTQAQAAAKKKADDKKKKKLAKEKRNRRGGIINQYAQDTQIYSSLDNQNRKPTQNGFTANTSGVSSTTQNQVNADNDAAETEQEKLSKELEKWKALLLERASQEKTTDFIRAFQSGEIKDTTFYTLIELMYDEATFEFQSLAVLAAGSVSNLRSFDFLASVVADQSQGSFVSSQAQKEINEYKVISAVNVLKQVFISRVEDELKVLLAIQAFENATEIYFSADQATEAQKQIFASFVAPVESILSLYTQNSEIKQASEKSLERIKPFATVVAQTNGL